MEKTAAFDQLNAERFYTALVDLRAEMTAAAQPEPAETQRRLSPQPGGRGDPQRHDRRDNPEGLLQGGTAYAVPPCFMPVIVRHRSLVSRTSGGLYWAVPRMDKG